jgi:hypothetical protein
MPDTDFSLNFVCPTCGARPHEECDLKSDAPRFTSHAERRSIAEDYLGSAAFSAGSPLSVWDGKRVARNAYRTLIQGPNRATGLFATRYPEPR